MKGVVKISRYVPSIFFYLLLLVFVNLIGCNFNQKQDTQEAVHESVYKFYMQSGRYIQKSQISIVEKIPYKSGYLVLSKYNGEGPALVLFYITKERQNNYSILNRTDGEFAISMGFSANLATYDENNILFGSLNESTWIPETDKRKVTDYSKLVIQLSNGSSISSNVFKKKGYVVILDKEIEVKDMLFYDAQDRIVSTLADLGNINKPQFTSSTHILPISDKELSTYKEYSQTKTDNILSHLSPIEICKLYFHAVKTRDISTQYAFYIRGDEYLVPSYKQFLKETSNTVDIENTKLLIDKLEQDVEVVRERTIDSKHAVVEIISKSGNNDMHFSVMKSNGGIWKVAWMPLQ